MVCLGVFHSVNQQLTADAEEQGARLGNQRYRWRSGVNPDVNAVLGCHPLPEALESGFESQFVEDGRTQFKREGTRGPDDVLQEPVDLVQGLPARLDRLRCEVLADSNLGNRQALPNIIMQSYGDPSPFLLFGQG